MKKQPKSDYRWTWDYSDAGRVWRMTVRATGQLVGQAPRADLDNGTSAWEALVWMGPGGWVSLGLYDHWAAAKRAVQSSYTGIRLHEAVRQ